jgi:hypothetical protein
MRQLVVLSLFVVWMASADEDDPYVYQRVVMVAPARVEVETAVGTRDARPFGERGVEESARAPFRVSIAWSCR